MIYPIDLHFLGHEHTIAAFLVVTSDGPLLIETGPHSTLPYLEKGIAAHGFHLEDIKKVFLTHIHLDHAGAAWAFAEKGAIIYLHPFGARNMEDPSRLMDSARRIYQDKMDMLWGQMNPIPKQQLYEVAHGEEFKLGNTVLKAWHTPGHAKHHIAWQVGDVVFTGDVAGVKINDGIVVPPCPPPDINLEEWMDSIALLRQLQANTFYLTHFDGIKNTSEHLDKLESILWDWAHWMKAQWETGKSAEEITPLFMQYVANQLLSSGLPKESIAQYEAANPSWMSVAGLMRYWAKKAEGK